MGSSFVQANEHIMFRTSLLYLAFLMDPNQDMIVTSEAELNLPLVEGVVDNNEQLNDVSKLSVLDLSMTLTSIFIFHVNIAVSITGEEMTIDRIHRFT
jgi:hypothetical protein